jgi:hypothetical protein
MAPSINVVDTDVHAETESKKKKRKSKDLTALQENADVCDDSSKKKKKKKKVSVNNDENDSNPGSEETELTEIVAKYLSKRGLSKTLSSFISETQCVSPFRILIYRNLFWMTCIYVYIYHWIIIREFSNRLMGEITHSSQ